MNKLNSVLLEHPYGLSSLVALGIYSNKSYRATHGKSYGKWYWEVKLDSVGVAMIGIVNRLQPLNTISYTTGNARFYYYNGAKYETVAASYGLAYTTGDVVSVLLDMDNGQVTFWKNGVSQGVAFSNLSLLEGEIFPILSSGSTSTPTNVTVNFGSTGVPFVYAIPDGYLPYANDKFHTDKLLISSGDDYKSIELKRGEKLTPVMTSNTTPTGFGQVIYSTQYSTSGNYSAYQAFNNVHAGIIGSTTYDGWLTPDGTLTGWVGFEFLEKKSIGRYYMMSRGGSETSAPKDWTLEGSDDGFLTYEILDTQTDVSTWVFGISKEFILKRPKAFKAFRVNVTAINGSPNYVAIQELMFHDVYETSVKYVSKTEQNFKRHGMKKSIEIYPSSANKFPDHFSDTKIFVNQESENFGSGKIYKKIVNTDILSVKNVSIY